MKQVHFLENPEGHISVTSFEEEYLRKYMSENKYICSKILSDFEWEQILSFPTSDREKISTFLKTRYLESTIKSRVLYIVGFIASSLLPNVQNEQKVKCT